MGLGAARRRSADQVIRAALAAMKRDERRAVAAAEARAIKDDPEDRAEIEALQKDAAALRTPEQDDSPYPILTKHQP